MISDSDFKLFSRYIEVKSGLKIMDTTERAVKRFLVDKLDNLSLSIKEYIDILDSDSLEFHIVINQITINETYFFREYKHFDFLDTSFFPYFKDKSDIPPVLWSAAGSIGAEAVSLSVLSNKYWKNRFSNNVIVTDIDVISLKSLEANRYSQRLLKEDGRKFHVLIENNSTIENDSIVFNEEIIRNIKYFRFNLIKDDYDLINYKFDVVFLCNLLTYMDFEKKKYIIDKVVSKINEDGILILSSSDTAFIEHSELALEQYNNSFYFKKNPVRIKL